jgi:hypothetical protein
LELLAVPEVASLVHLLEVLRELLLRLIGGLLLPRLVQGISLGHPAVELGRTRVTVFLEDAVQVQVCSHRAPLGQRQGWLGPGGENQVQGEGRG